MNSGFNPPPIGDRPEPPPSPPATGETALLERITVAIETAAGALVMIAGVITQPDASEETGAPDPLSTMDR
jgi:hypothetical protein